MAKINISIQEIQGNLYDLLTTIEQKQLKWNRMRICLHASVTESDKIECCFVDNI